MTHPHPLHLTSYITTRSTLHPSPTTRTTGKPPLTPHRYTSTPTPPQTPVSPLMSHTSHHLSHQITHTTPHLHHHSHGLTPIPPTILVYITTHTHHAHVHIHSRHTPSSRQRSNTAPQPMHFLYQNPPEAAGNGWQIFHSMLKASHPPTFILFL